MPEECCGIGEKDAKLIAGAVWLHFELNGQTLSIVSEWTLRAVDAHNRAAEWLEQENPELHEITDITATLVWTRLTPDTVRTLVPSDLLPLL